MAAYASALVVGHVSSVYIRESGEFKALVHNCICEAARNVYNNSFKNEYYQFIEFRF